MWSQTVEHSGDTDTRMTDGQPLAVLMALVADLNARSVRYCHWKSNEHLAAALAGRTDVDLLVDPNDLEVFDRIAAENGFIEATTPAPKRLPGVRHLYGMDPATGVLAHLHVHDRLVLGELRVKNHRLPAEAWVLDHLIMKLGMPIPKPEVELVLLYIRSLMKTTLRAGLRTVLRRQDHPFPAGIRRELARLADQVDDATVMGTIDEAPVQLDRTALAEFVRRVRANDLPVGYVLSARRHLLREMRPYRRYGALTAAARKVWFRLRFSRPAGMLSPIPAKRVVAGGLIVAVVGADGSGKTTLSHDLVSWLRPSLDTRHVYFGQPKGDPILRVTRRLGRTLKDRARDGNGHSFLADTNAALQWLYVAGGRKRAARSIGHLRCGGSVIVAERYPLREFWDMKHPMDGPRLGRSDTRGTRAERRIYEQIPRPDLCLVLRADVAILRDRKPSTPADEVVAKFQAVERLADTDDPTVVVIDAERPYGEVLHAAQEAVWHCLTTTGLH